MKPYSETCFYKSKKPYLERTFLQSCIAFIILVFSSCTSGKPKGIEPVKNFNLDRYLGTWYEIARLDHSFEKNLEEVKAVYSKQPDGSIRVENSGRPMGGGKRKTKVGKAVVVDNPTVGHLKVSFFGPFYGSYVIFYLEEDYSAALVCGSDRSYCWILSRKPTISEEARVRYLKELEARKFNTKKLIFPKACEEPCK